MTVETFSPSGLLQPVPYAHVAVATGTHQVHVAGQIARDADGQQIAPGDLAGQVAHALRNVHRALSGAGASLSDVVRLRFYVVDWRPEQMTAFLAGVEEVAEEIGLPTPMPPASLIGVSVLFEPGVLVEVEADAVLP